MTTINRSSWGPRASIGASIKELRDLNGNRDGIWDNEKAAKGTLPDAFDRNPAVLRAKAHASVGLSADDEIKVLKQFRAEVEARHGQPVMSREIESQLNGGELFAAQKALALERYGRVPSDVVEKFVTAKGTVDGHEIPAARVFTQHWKAQGTPTGDVVVMSPGFLETGRAFLDEVERLNKAGVDVIVMDHQWAGQTEGKKGGILNGESIALHTAAVTADAAQLAKRLYGDKGKVTLVGESMGGGPGALGAVLMNDHGRLQLDGAPMPKGINVVLQAPYLGATPGLINGTLHAASNLPLLNKLAMPALGVPDFVDDKRGEVTVSQGMVLEDIRGQLQAFSASDRFVANIKKMVESGAVPQGRVHILHDSKDPLADPKQSDWLAGKLGSKATLTRMHDGDHGLSASDATLCADTILASLRR